MSMYLKARTAITFALSLALFAPAQTPGLADGPEPAPAVSDPARATGKVLVLLVYDQHCKVWCTSVRPIMKELAAEFGDKVHMEEVDASPSSADATLKQVKELGILFLYKDIEAVPEVLICGVNRKKYRELNGPKKKEVYKEAIGQFIAKGQ
jgi:hypothetical protein